MTNNEKTVLEKLVDELRAELSTTQLNCDLWHDRAEDMRNRLSETQAENAKLRELVRDLYCLAYPSTVEWKVSDATYDKYSPCEKCQELHGGKSPCAVTAKDMTEECCAPIQANVVADRMRELGIEVDA